MPIHDHQPAFHGRVFFWGGIGLGFLLVAALLTHGFGLLGSAAKVAEAPAWTARQGNKIVIPEGSPLRSRLTVAPASAEEVKPKLVLPGIVESDPARTATVVPQLSGRVLNLTVRLGDRVVKGQVLAVLDSADLAQAYDDYDKAADAYKLTQKNLGRQQEQSKIGVVSDRDLDQATSDNAQAEAEYTRTRARLKILDAPTDSRGPARQLTVRAPVGGSVTTLSVTPNSTINDPTQPLMTIADLSTVWVTAMVPEKDVGVVARGQDADVRLVAYPDRTLHGKVLFVGDVIEPDSRRNKIRIAFANTDYALKPNMFATVTLVGSPQSQVVLPSSSLLMNNDRTSVFVATAPWTFERRTVEPQLEDGPSVAIRSGVAAGEQVVVKGGILLND
ncbi:MAG TPA: efflux RND transporter periplasmic adaptor subunit [Steroidobacteraceae bacterium]|nr:efflux RND transporter periplasmic adaptor subunit [Steroidobacteraceae bacterium]